MTDQSPDNLEETEILDPAAANDADGSVVPSAAVPTSIDEDNVQNPPDSAPAEVNPSQAETVPPSVSVVSAAATSEPPPGANSPESTQIDREVGIALPGRNPPTPNAEAAPAAESASSRLTAAESASSRSTGAESASSRSTGAESASSRSTGADRASLVLPLPPEAQPPADSDPGLSAPVSVPTLSTALTPASSSSSAPVVSTPSALPAGTTNDDDNAAGQLDSGAQPQPASITGSPSTAAPENTSTPGSAPAVTERESPQRTATPSTLLSATAPPGTPKSKKNILAGKFRLKREIAKGAMGRVFLAEQIALKREVAVKVLVPKFGGPDFDKRFMQEARAVASLSHPNIVVVHDYGKVNNNLLFMAMEYLKGPTLSQIVRERGAVSLGRSCSIILQIARALRAAHKAGMIHRDLKPGNVIVLHDDDEGDQVKVLDFGLAKMLSTTQDEVAEDDAFATREGLMLGTPRYMAPEQITAKEVDERTDIYSLGAVFYHMVSGIPPFEGDNDVEILHAQLKGKQKPIAELPGREDFPPNIQAFIDKCMAIKKGDRFESVRVLIQVLKGLVADGMNDPETRDLFVTGAENAQTENQLLSATAGYGSSSASKVALAEPGSSSVSRPIVFSIPDGVPDDSVVDTSPVFPGETESGITAINPRTNTPRTVTPPPTPAFNPPPVPPAQQDEPKRTGAIAAGIVLSLLLVAAAVFYFNPFGPGEPVAADPSVPRIKEEGGSAKTVDDVAATGEAKPTPALSSGEKNAPPSTRNVATKRNGEAADAQPLAKVTTTPSSSKLPKRVARSRRRRAPSSKATKPAPASSTTETKSAENDKADTFGLMSADEATGASDRSSSSGKESAKRGGDSVNVGGVELMSPSSVDRAKAPTKKRTDQVKVGDVILADDYE